jgi:hypothetical protein
VIEAGFCRGMYNGLFMSPQYDCLLYEISVVLAKPANITPVASDVQARWSRAIQLQPYYILVHNIM